MRSIFLVLIPYQGEWLALLAAMAWAVAVILFKRSEGASAQSLNLFKNTTSTLLLLITLLIFEIPIDWGRPYEIWLKIALSGILGIAIADTLFFMALQRLGPSLLAIVECSYAPMLVLGSILFLDESPGLLFALGAVLVVAGVGVASIDDSFGALPKETRRIGVVFGLLCIATMVGGIIVIKPVLPDASLLEITTLRLAFGAGGQLLWVLMTGNHRKVLQIFKPQPIWRTLVPGTLLGTYIAMILWLGGFKWADASVAGILNQMSTIFIILLARIFLKDPLTLHRSVGALLGIVGSLIILLAPSL